MKKVKKSAADQLSRLAREASTTKLQSREDVAPPLADEKLAALLKNLGRIVVVSTKDLRLSDNVRKYVPTDTPEFYQLLDSVRKDGILQNLVVDLVVQPDGKYALNVVSGQRRFMAAEKAGVGQCPVRVMQYSDRAAKLAHGIAENVLRDNLHCLDLAEAYADLLQEGWDEAQIAETFDRKRQTVMQLLRLARYPEAAKRVIREQMEQFTAYDLLNKFVAHKWDSTAQLVTALKAHGQGRQVVKQRAQTDAGLRTRCKELSQKIGYRLNVSGTKQAGQLVVKWSSPAQQEQLFQLLKQLTENKR